MSQKTVLSLIALLALSFGCGKSSTYETKDGQVKIEEKSGQATYEVTTKEGKLKMATGDKSVPLPDNFPKDVPIYKGAVVKMAASQGAQLVVHIHVAASVADAAKFYQDQLKSQGWEIGTTMNMGDTSMITANKAGRQCAVVAAKEDDGALVQISVSSGT
ncbi:MAG: hypothetical protein NTY01_23845 [Verrucomicrobia bacterium]|nr:hypothetical protein [Verrucomicrobiota bacterium]